MAQLEWLCDRATRLPREAWLVEPDLTAEGELGRIRGSTLCFRARHTILELWSDHRRGGVEAIRVETIRRHPQHLLVWSDAGSPRVTEITSALYARSRDGRV